MRRINRLLGLALTAAVGATLGHFAGPASAGVAPIGGADLLAVGGACGSCSSNECKTFASYPCIAVSTFCREKKHEAVSVAHCAQAGDTGCVLTNPILCATIYDNCDCEIVDGKRTCKDCDTDQDYRPKDCAPEKK
jgi:hypothetical protein